LAALIGEGMGDALASLRHLHCGGEALTPDLLAALRDGFPGAVHEALDGINPFILAPANPVTV
uniref:hypothetical protein n=1 Tax=Nocardia cyriacigeorgica TaxID=135487 RepID=UPI002454431C